MQGHGRSSTIAGVALVLLACLAGCGGARQPGPSQDPSRAVAASSPVCQATPAADRSVRSTARETIAVFLSVFNRRRDLARGWLAPEATAEIMAGLAPVTHLDLVKLDHRY